MKAMTLFAAGAALIALSVPAHADAIDGDWCRADGKRMSIHGPAIVTPGGGTHLAPRTGRIINAAHLTFGTLNLTGDTILDFSNRSARFLTSASLNISELKLCRQISRIKPR